MKSNTLMQAWCPCSLGAPGGGDQLVELDADATLLRAHHMSRRAGSVPMFPRNLAEGAFSLRPHQESCALSVWVTLDPVGGIADCGAVCSTVRCQRLTYDALEESLAGSEGAGSTSVLQILNQVRLCSLPHDKCMDYTPPPASALRKMCDAVGGSPA